MGRRLRTPGEHPNEVEPRLWRGRHVPGEIGLWRGPNLLVDGDCEAVGVGDWTAAGGGGSLLKSDTSPAPLSGSRSLKLLSSGGLIAAAQVVITIGVTYRLTCICYTSARYFQIKADTDVIAQDGTNGVVLEIDETFTAIGTGNLAWLFVGNTSGQYMLIDNCHLSEE